MVYPHAAADTVEPAVRRAIQKVVGQAKGSHVDALKGALADAQAKLAAGRRRVGRQRPELTTSKAVAPVRANRVAPVES